MAGDEISEKPMFKLKLIVDKKKSKVVLAEAGKDFVNVLFSFLTLPMGTIVRLLEKYQQQNQKSQAATIGCFNNLYRSVLEVGTSSFMTEACKDMLLYPRSVEEKQCRRLKINVDDTDVLKYYICPNSYCEESCHACSNFCSSRCCCGTLMDKVCEIHDSSCHDLFMSEKTLFTITDDMEVRFTSMGLTLKTLKRLGYADVDQLHEMFVDVDHEKILALLHCLFSSNTPLTDVFLMKRSSCVITKSHNMQSLALQEKDAGKGMSVSVFTRKLDRKVLYVESGKDFVDLLFTLLVLPLNSAWKLSGSNIVYGCISNLCESFKILSSSDLRNTLTEKSCVLPWNYSCQQPLLDVCYSNRVMVSSKRVNRPPYNLTLMDPRCNRWDENAESATYSGFLKSGTTFMVSDDLTITPMNLSSNISLLKKCKMDLDDIEEQVINISKVESIKLLRSSFMTSTASNTAFGSLLSKKPKEEKL